MKSDKQEYLLLNFCSMLAKVSLLGRLPGTEQGPESLCCVDTLRVYSLLSQKTHSERKISSFQSRELPGTLEVLVLLGAAQATLIARLCHSPIKQK